MQEKYLLDLVGGVLLEKTNLPLSFLELFSYYGEYIFFSLLSKITTLRYCDLVGFWFIRGWSLVKVEERGKSDNCWLLWSFEVIVLLRSAIATLLLCYTQQLCNWKEIYNHNSQ